MKYEFEDFYQDYFIFQRLGRGKYYTESYPDAIKNNRLKPKQLIKDFLNLFESILYNKSKTRPCILIWETKFKEIIEDHVKFYNFIVVTNSLKKYKQVSKIKGIKVYFAHHWYDLIDKGFETHNMKYTKEAVDKIKKYIKKNNIRVVILGNDKMFIERAIKAAAEEINVPVVIIQHGIYNIDSFKQLQTADSARHFWVWSEYIKDIYLKYTGKQDTDIKVIGYPFRLDIVPVKNKRKVLFLGNQYLNYNKKEGDGYFKIAETVYDICKKNNLEFVYRPHPSEKITSKYNIFKEKISKNSSLMFDLKETWVVVGDISSTMVEAALVGRPVVQVIWRPRSEIGVTDPMYGFTKKTINDKSHIEKTILNCVESEYVNSLNKYYIMRNDNLKQDIKKYIDELINEKC